MYVKQTKAIYGIPLTDMTIAQQIGKNIKIARKYKGLTQKEMAQTFFMTQQQYSRFENGVFELNYKQILDICALLDLTPNEVFDINDEKIKA